MISKKYFLGGASLNISNINVTQSLNSHNLLKMDMLLESNSFILNIFTKFIFSLKNEVSDQRQSFSGSISNSNNILQISKQAKNFIYQPLKTFVVVKKDLTNDRLLNAQLISNQIKMQNLFNLNLLDLINRELDHVEVDHKKINEYIMSLSDLGRDIQLTENDQVMYYPFGGADPTVLNILPRGNNLIISDKESFGNLEDIIKFLLFADDKRKSGGKISGFDSLAGDIPALKKLCVLIATAFIIL